MTDRHIPQDLDAEEALIGACILSPKARDAASAHGIVRESFLRPAHRLVWDAIVALAEAGEVDELTVYRWLDDRGRSAEVGGLVGVSTLADRCPAVANASAYARAVRASWLRREAVIVGEAVAALGYGEGDPATLRERAIALVERFAERASAADGAIITTLADQMTAFYDDMTERHERGGLLAGVPTGLRALDERWGGLQPGRLYVIAGRPGMGKSALGMGIVEAAAFGSAVESLCFNFEMMPVEQGGRMIARHGRLNLHRLANTAPTEQEFQAAYETIAATCEAATRIAVDESPSLTAGEVRERAREYARALRKEGRKLGLILVDYLQKVKPGSDSEKEYDTVTQAAGIMKALALELQVPVIALAQLNRGADGRKTREPSLSDLRGSGAIEQDADVVLLLHRPEYYGDDSVEWRGRALAATAKNRVGPDGVDDLRWEGQHVRYSDWTGPVFMAGSPVRAS